MKTKLVIPVLLFICLNFSPYITIGQTNSAKSEVSLQIDGSKRFQQIDGFGVNANTASWNGKELEPALDLLLDSMNSTIWRVMVEMEKDWEDVNDNNDPFTFNWDYYNKLYETPKFQKAWNTIEYLNNHGITNMIMINFMGRVPEWMGKDVIKPEFEDEFVEMQVSFLLYARNVRHLQIGRLSPTNESDIRNEGPTVGAKQYSRILRKLIDRMAAVGLGDIPIVAPDVASLNKGVKEYIPALMEDPIIMSKIAHFGLHSYGGGGSNVNTFLKESTYPKSGFWITEWNAWRNGLDAGQTTEYNYKFASECVNYLLQLLKNGTSAGIAWEGYDSYYEHPPGGWSLWGILGYNQQTKTYTPRKHFYAISQISKFVLPGSWRISVSESGDSLTVLAFQYYLKSVIIVGINIQNNPVTIKGSLANLPEIDRLEMYHTNSSDNLHKDDDVTVTGKEFKTTIPANCIFTLMGKEGGNKNASTKRKKPEPSDWYAGDMHLHRNCGDDTPVVLPEDKFTEMMEPNDLAVISVLACIGNAEVTDPKADFPKVNGLDAPESNPGRIVHWDAEWHWDATYVQFEHQALSGHIVLLGLKKAYQIWDESPYKILEWAKNQDAICGYAHMQYLNDKVQNKLDCCIPIDFPVEAALGTIDFVSEDVNGSEPAMNAYYKLLNCGFKLGLAAGTDYPCNNSKPFGTLLTYVNVKDTLLTYRKWIEGIKKGNTVISRNGHNEFLEMKINGKYEPGDEISIKNKGTVTIEVKWTAVKELSGTIELVSNGKVVSSQSGAVMPGKPLILEASKEFTESGWICARRMDEKGHQTHTAPIYITVNEKPVRASAEDAEYFVKWIDNILNNIAPGGVWNHFFTHDIETVQNQYQKAREIYSKILAEAQANN